MEDNLLSPGLIDAGLIKKPRTVSDLRLEIMTTCNTCCGRIAVDPSDNEVTCVHNPIIDCVLPRLLRLALKDDTLAEKLPSDWIMRHARQTEQDIVHESRPSE